MPSVTRALAPWTARRLGVVAGGWATLAFVEYLVVVTSTPGGARLAALLPYYGVLALTWTLLTPLVARWEDRRHGVVATLVGIVGAAAIDTTARRLVLAAQGEWPASPWYATAVYFLDVTVAQYGAVLLATRVLDAHDAVLARVRAELMLRAQLARTRLAYLEAQLQPHFLFNALGTVAELAYEAPATAARMLRALAALLRAATERRGEDVTLAEELATLEPYLEIQRMRFADWLRIEQRVSPGARDVRVPRLLLQPLVENAIKHGLVGRSARGRIEIAARVEDGRLEVVVRDNGVGLSAPTHVPGYGLGLRNVRERLAALYGSEWTLDLHEAPNGGADVALSIPARRTPATDSIDAEPNDGPRAGRLLAFVQRHPAAATIVGWLLWGSAWAGQSRAYLVMRGRLEEAELSRVVVTHLSGALLWAVATPLVLWLTGVVTLQRRGAAWRVALHLALSAAVAVVHALAWRVALDAMLHADAPPWPAAYVTTLFISVLAYWIVLGVGHHGRVTAWLHERERLEVTLRAEIAESRLQAATVRAQPEVIVRTLDELAETVERDVAATERAITALADELRGTLDSRGAGSSSAEASAEAFAEAIARSVSEPPLRVA